MPFNEQLNQYYKNIIKPAVESVNLKCLRADEIYGTRSIIKDIVDEIEKSKILIADLTEKNPNVNYELGIAHALGKPVVIIVQDLKDVPFDLKHLRIIVYKLSDFDWAAKLGNNIKNTLEVVLKDPELSIAFKLKKRNLELSDDIKDLLMSSFKSYEGSFKSTETIMVDELGNCVITKDRFQRAGTDMSLLMTESYLDKPGEIKLLKVIDNDSKAELNFHTYKKSSTGHCFFIILNDLKLKSSVFTYSIKMHAENYLSDLIEKKIGFRKISPYQKIKMETLNETYLFPNTKQFSDLEISISDHPNKSFVGEIIGLKEVNKQFKIYEINHGDLSDYSGEIEVKFTL